MKQKIKTSELIKKIVHGTANLFSLDEEQIHICIHYENDYFTVSCSEILFDRNNRMINSELTDPKAGVPFLIGEGPFIRNALMDYLTQVEEYLEEKNNS